MSRFRALMSLSPDGLVRMRKDGSFTMNGPHPTEQQIAAKMAELEKAKLIAAIKAEAHRRIIAIIPEWKQRNLLAQGTVLTEKGRANWTTDELAAWDAALAIWSQVNAIRVASDKLEAMKQIPQDYADDKYWGVA